MTTPLCSLRQLTATHSWLRRLHKLQKLHSLASLNPSSISQYPQGQEQRQQERAQKTQQNLLINNKKKDSIVSDVDNNSSSSFFPKRGQTLELVCESLAFKGKGVCKVADTGFVVMCDRALPGERFIGRVTRRKGSYAEVTKVKTISPHLDIIDAPCEYASYCGGCKTQNLSYEAQLRAKEQQVLELMTHVGKFSDKDLDMKSIVPCDIQFHYRNKMEFSFGSQKWLPRDLLGEKQDGVENFALGLHAPGFFDKVLNVDKCLLQSEPANKVLATIQDFWRDPQLGLTPYDIKSHVGFLKHLMLRTGRNSKTGLLELMVNFVTSSYNPQLLKPLVEKISAIPEVAEVLYKLIEDCAGLRGDSSEIVLDLFCGTGTIGLTLARRAKNVYGYEVVPQAISDARKNAELNGITNATFVQGDLNKIVKILATIFQSLTLSFQGQEYFGIGYLVGSSFLGQKLHYVCLLQRGQFSSASLFTVVLLCNFADPNRPGMHMKLIKFLLKLKAPCIVYVSCNPATCARDLDYLCHGLVRRVTDCSISED
ncbi:hypothetical protein GH714_035867 [Hevea brasiliensis]|uniref:TRAM domain-containing protein n=1 Tax=Hevea brasiliensis TaxID=3981 RepID=A0A6A6NDZ9_HEVBR|nr:hypothetical protein GH714_035867 [Hevea brasiliensis]